MNVRGVVHYSHLDESKDSVYVPSAAEGKKEGDWGKTNPQMVDIVDARSELNDDEKNLDKAGFLLTEFSDAAPSPGEQAPVEALVQKLTGADEVIAFDNTYRATDEATRLKNKWREHAAVVHGDYTIDGMNSGQLRFNHWFDVEHPEQPKPSFRRLVIVNVWRPKNQDVESFPLCLCDGRSVDPLKDVRGVVRDAKERKGQVYLVRHSSAHKWFWFPNMRVGKEAVVFKTYDTAQTAQEAAGDDSSEDSSHFTRFCIHTAFDHKTGKGRPRESLETRLFVLYR